LTHQCRELASRNSGRRIFREFFQRHPNITRLQIDVYDGWEFSDVEDYDVVEEIKDLLPNLIIVEDEIQ
jgi:hypothetical protein